MTGALALSGKVEGVGDVTVKLEGVRDDASLFVFPDAKKGEVQDAEVGQLAVAVQDMDGVLRAMVRGESQRLRSRVSLTLCMDEVG